MRLGVIAVTALGANQRARAADSETRIARLTLWEVVNPLITRIASGY